MRSETFSTAGPVRLNLEIPTGEIELETAQTEETHVELEAVSDDDAVRDLVENARIELMRRGDGYEVAVEAKTRQGIFISISRSTGIRFGSPDVRLRISCPHGAALDVRTKSADLRARGEYGSVEFKTASGDIELDEAKGPAHIKTVSGDVHIERAGSSLEVQAVSGDLYVRESRGSITANTVSGDQRFEAVQEGRVEVKAISGDVSVGIRSGSRFYVDANTVSGATSSELELGDAPAEEAAPGAPLVEVFAKTVSGDVRIERAPAQAQIASN